MQEKASLSVSSAGKIEPATQQRNVLTWLFLGVGVALIGASAFVIALAPNTDMLARIDSLLSNASDADNVAQAQFRQLVMSVRVFAFGVLLASIALVRTTSIVLRRASQE